MQRDTRDTRYNDAAYRVYNAFTGATTCPAGSRDEAQATCERLNAERSSDPNFAADWS